MKEDKYESQANQIRQLCEQNGMEVYTKLIRRLITGNAPTIFPNINRQIENPHNYRLLAEEVQKASENTSLARDVAEAIAGNDADLFKDFDLAGFMRHFNLDALGRSVFALGFKNSPKQDLRNKAHDIITNAFSAMLEVLGNPAKHENWEPSLIAQYLVDYLSDPLPSFFDLNAKLNLSYAARVRFSSSTIPDEIQTVTEPVEKLRGQESLRRLFTMAGSNSTNSLDACREVLKRKWKVELSEEEVAEMLITMATSSHPTDWNPEIFIKAILENNIGPAFDWNLLIDVLDKPEFVIEDPDGLSLLIRGLLVATQKNPDLEISRLWSGRKNNPKSHLSIMKALLSRKFESFNLAKVPNLQKIVSINEQFQDAPAKLSALATTYENQKLNSLGAVQSLLYLAVDRSIPKDVKSEAKALVDRQWKLVPELLLVGAFIADKPWAQEHEVIVTRLFGLFFDGSPSRQLVFYLLWSYDRLGVMEFFVDIYRADKLKVTRILEIAKEIQILWDLTKSIAFFELALDIACLAAVSDALNLEKWLTEMLAENGKDFIDQTLVFLESRSVADYEFQPSEPEKTRTQVSLHAAEVSQIIEACEQSEHATLAGPEQREFMVSIQRRCIQSYPRLINLRQGHDHIILSANRNKNTFSPDVDKKMQEYYQKMYSGEITITTMVKDLQNLKNSDTVQDQDLFACMIHSLFDEYTCYPSYPIEPLATTSVLFGSLIEYHLLEGLALNVALGMVLDAVKKHPPKDNMYKFGLQALKHFPKRLQEWRGFCQHLTTIPGLQNTDIMDIALRVVSSGDGQPTLSDIDAEGDQIPFPNIPNGGGSSIEPTLTPQPIAAFKALRLDQSPQDEDSYEEPVERVRDKVLFIVNNLTASNLDVKLKEFQSCLNEKAYRWFADYLVVQRARLEPNNHKLYIDFLDGLDSRMLQAEVLHETFRNAFNLLNSENTIHSATDRAHLKHLGIWLGGLTLAKDKPIKHKAIGFKELLIEAYDSQRLVVALPFTCKVLEQASKSTVFRPPNPWTMAILRLLAELYHFAELKLNLKFEIEVLCKALGTDIKNMEASTEIRDRPPLQEETEALVDGLGDFGGMIFSRDERADRFSENAINSLLPDLHNQIVINNTLNGFGQHPKIRSILTAAIERAIREIMSPVVERSVTIAAISTSQLILKDFAAEPSEDKMRKAAHSMVQTMAGSLALVTCKEPLRMSMSNHIRQLLATNGYPEPSFADQAILVIVNDNLELASAVIERAAQEKAMPEIDDNLQQAYGVRRLHRERNRQNGQPFADPAISRYMVSLPEPFRLKPGGLSPTQLNVYDDFSRMPRASGDTIANARMSQEVITDFAPIGQPSEDPSPVPLTHQNLALAQQQQQQQQQQQSQQRQTLLPPPAIVSRPAQSPSEMFKTTRDRMFEILNDLGVLFKEASVESLTDLPESSHIKTLMNDFVRIAAGSPFMENLCLTLASFLYKFTYERAESPIEAETYVFLLEKLCQLSQATQQEVLASIVSPDNDHLFNLPATNLLIRARLIPLNMLDVTIARAIESNKPGAIEFLSSLIREIVLGPDPIALRSDFAGSLDKVSHLSLQDPQNTVGRSLLLDLQKFEMPPPPAEDEQPPEEVTIRDQYAYIFEEWVQLCDHPSTTERTFAAFISQMYKENTLGEPASSALFFRTCIETAIEHHEKEITTAEDPTFNSVYSQVDSLAKLVILLAKYHLELESESLSKAEYLRSIFSVIILVFNHQHEIMNGAVFNQKVFYRLFSSLLCEWHEVESQLEQYQRPIMLAFYDMIMALQPVYYPAFAFAWASLVAHRLFVPKMIALTDDDGWNLYERVLERLLRYLGGLVKSPELVDEILHFYRGILRFLLVLHHDFPDFLAEYHNSICASIPTNCTQLRNLILSAFPIGSKELPDPFTHGLKVDRLPEIRKPPKIALPHTFGERLAQLEIKEAVDRCLNEGPKEADIALVASKMILKSPGFDRVNVDDFSLNSLVIYVVMHAISVGEKRGSAAFIPNSPHTNFLFELAEVFNPEARYYFLGAMANQLRYPNSHTHFFSCTLLSLFGHVKGTQFELDIRQQITRVLLERLIVHRPHPWGLIITLLELLKNPSYEFWNLSFIKAAPEIEKLFDALFAHVNHSPQL